MPAPRRRLTLISATAVLVICVQSLHPQDSDQPTLEPEVLKHLQDATVLVWWRHNNLFFTSLGFVASPSGHVLFAHEYARENQPITEVRVVFRGGTPEETTVHAEFIVRDSYCSLVKIPGDGLSFLATPRSIELKDKDEAWMAIPVPQDFEFKKMPRSISYRKCLVQEVRTPRESMKVSGDRSLRGAAIVNAKGELVGMNGVSRPGWGNSLNVEGIREYLKLRTYATVTPRALPAEGGRVSIQARVQSALRPIDRVVAAIRQGESHIEIPLKASGDVWSAEWACSGLDKEGLGRYEVQLIMKDQTMKTIVSKAKGLVLETNAGTQSIAMEELKQIRFGADKKPSRVLTETGWREGTFKSDDLGFSESDVELALFEQRTGRTYEIGIVATAGDQEAWSTPVSVSVGGAHNPPPDVQYTARLSGQVVKKFPGTPGRMQLCGGGRYLLIHFTNMNSLGLFDFERVDFAAHFRLDPGQVLFAGGRKKLLILYPELSRLERWSLESLEREVALPSPFKTASQAVALGWNSDGPAIVIGPLVHNEQRAEVGFLDVHSLQLQRRKCEPLFISTGFEKIFNLRTSKWGDRIAWWGSRPGGLSGVFEVGDHGLRQHTMVDSKGYWVPGELNTIFSSWGVLNSEDLPQYDERRKRETKRYSTIPAVDGALFLSLTTITDSDSDLTGVIRGLSGEKVYTLNFPVLDSYQQRRIPENELSIDNRLWFHPRAKLLVTVPKTNDRLICTPFDLEGRLQQSEVDYLYVASTPSTVTVSGADWMYPVQVKSKRGKVSLQMVEGPDGMKAGEGLTMRWKPMQPGVHRVRLLISDASGQEVEQTFNLTVQ